MIRDLADLPWPVQTARLLLRPATLDDIDEIWAFRRLPEVVRYLSHDVMTREEVVSRVTDRIQRATLDAARPCLGLAVLDRETGCLVGDAMLSLSRAGSISREPSDEWQATIGYAFAPQWHGRGFASEVARELVRIAFMDLEVRRITAEAFTGNHASNRVLAKVGFRLEATHRAAVRGKDGTWLDDNTWALLRDEWHSRTRPAPASSPVPPTR